MAEIQSTPHLEDPLGAPKVVTGPEYLDALAHLGYNVENMNSNIPFALATQKAAASLITNQYDQAMQWQKSQADIAETMARAKNYDSVTKYNNESLGLRLAGLDTENKLREVQIQEGKNKNALFNATLDAQINDANQRSAQANQLTQLGTLDLKTKQRQSDETDQALADQDAALASLASIKPDDPEFESKVADATHQHLTFATNPNTRQKWADSIDQLRNVRGGLASVQRQKENVTLLQKALDTHDLPDYVRDHLNAIANDGQATHAWNAYANLSSTNKQITRILSYLDVTGVARTPQINKYIAALQNVQTQVNGMVADDNIAHKLATAQHSQYFDSNGDLHPEMQAELDALEDYGKLIGQGLTKPEESTRLFAPPTPGDYLGTHRSYRDMKRMPGETDAAWNQRTKAAQSELDRGIPAGPSTEPLSPEVLKGEKSFTPEEQTARWWAGPPGTGMRSLYNLITGTRPQAQTPQQAMQNLWSDRLKALQQSDPSMKAVVDKALNGTPEEQAAAKATLAERLQPQQERPSEFQEGGLVGTRTGLMKQTGGTIFDPAQVTAQSRDTVQANLAPGEYVVNKGAAQNVGYDTLDAINQTGMPGTTIRSAPQLTNPLGNINPMDLATRMISKAQQQPTADKTPPVTTGPATQPITPWWGGTPQQPSDKSVSKPSFTPQSIWPEAASAATAATGAAVQPGPMGAPAGTFMNPATGSYEPLQGQTVDVSGQPELRGLAYGPNSEGATAADQRQLKGVLGRLQPGDIAVSPNLESRYPMGSRVNIVDRNGKVILANQRVADRSYISEGKPTTNTFEIWNGRSLGQGYHLVPVGGGASAGIASAGTGGASDFAQRFGGAEGYQRGGLVSEEGSIGTRGARGTPGGGGIESQLDAPVDPRQRHRRFHPRVGAAGELGAIGADIPDPMQKKLAKLSQGYLSGLSDIIQQNPQMGPALLRHARHQLASNMGGQPEDWMGMSGGAAESRQMAQATPQVPPEAYGGGMGAYGGGGEGMGRGGRVGYQLGGAAMPEDVMNRAMLDPESMGLGYMQRGGLVRPTHHSNLLTAAYQGLYR